MRNTMIPVVLAVIVTSFSGKLLADGQVVEGVYQTNQTRYTQEGKKKGKIKITDKEIAGTPVLATTPRGLVKVIFKGKEMWLRASALKLSVPVLPGCPKSAPGRSADRTVPTSSGMGASCE